MEKRSPHYPLSAIQAVVAQCGINALTATARKNVAEMGLLGSEALLVLSNLDRSLFYKSMTTERDVRCWQDVYHAPCPNGKTAYIKLTLQDGAVVIQFKEK